MSALAATLLAAVALAGAPPPRYACASQTLVAEFAPSDYGVLFVPPLTELAGVTPTTSQLDGVCSPTIPGPLVWDGGRRARRLHATSLICRTPVPYQLALIPPVPATGGRLVAFVGRGGVFLDMVVGPHDSRIDWDPRFCRRPH
jgi:hypothetical protein